MAVRATISSGYRWRLGLLTAMVLGFGAFFVFDGLVRYPKQRANYAHYEQFIAGEIKGPDGQPLTDWAAYAKEQGLPGESSVKKGNHSDNDIYTQLVIGTPLVLIGLWIGVSFVRTFGRWVEADDDAIRTSWGQHCKISDITAIDDKRWASKGIAILKYKDQQAGIERALVLDDWKFDRAAMDSIFEHIAKTTGLVQLPPTEDPPADEAEATADTAQTSDADPEPSSDADTPRNT